MIRVLILLLLAAPAAFADDHMRPMKNLDVFELEVAADPQISPDGSRIAYARRAMDIMTDRPVSNIWTIDFDGGNHRPLLTGPESYSSARWSPSGDRIAFVSNVEGRGSQLQVIWMDSGQRAHLTNVRFSPGSLSWSPDGEYIAFSMFVPGETRPLAPPPPAPKGADWAPGATYIDRMPFRADGQGYLPVGHTHIFVVSSEGGTPRQLTSGDYNHGGNLAWTPDGSRIIFAANRQQDYQHDPVESELWSVDVTSGELTQLTDRNGPDFAPTISPDGKSVAYLGFDDRMMGYHTTGVYVLDLASGESRHVSGDFDRSIDDVQWAGSSRSFYVQYDDHGRTHLASMNMNGNITSITDDLGGVVVGRPYVSGDFSTANNGAFAYTAGRPTRPADVGVGRGNRPTRRLTDLNEDALGHVAVSDIEKITWTSSADDLEIEGWLAFPPGFDADKKYPLILEIHGGPRAAYGPQFSPEIQLYAAAGYVVLYANPRGSTSYGYDFVNEIHHNYPSEDYDDLMSGVDAVIERGYIDTDQLFVTGGSGGGVLTAWIVGKTDRFAAAVVAKPVINWISHTLTADGTHVWTRYWFEKKPWEDFETYWAQSPLSLVGNVNTPTALLTGEADYRTPIGESEQYYQALMLRKIPTALIRIPEAPHGIVSRPSHLMAKVDNILAWFERYRRKD
ncbi:MAG: S9 family peptidase [Woeseiaceae bacterium]|nr:S9 family peptidase [Woeseiaceae bacterium]